MVKFPVCRLKQTRIKIGKCSLSQKKEEEEEEESETNDKNQQKEKTDR